MYSVSWRVITSTSTTVHTVKLFEMTGYLIAFWVQFSIQVIISNWSTEVLRLKTRYMYP